MQEYGGHAKVTLAFVLMVLPTYLPTGIGATPGIFRMGIYHSGTYSLSINIIYTSEFHTV